MAGRIVLALQNFVIRDRHPLILDQRLIVTARDAIFDLPTIRDRAARDTGTGLFELLKPGAKFTAGIRRWSTQHPL